MPLALGFTLHFSIALKKAACVIIELSIKSWPVGPELHPSFDASSSPHGCCLLSHEGMKCWDSGLNAPGCRTKSWNFIKLVGARGRRPLWSNKNTAPEPWVWSYTGWDKIKKSLQKSTLAFNGGWNSEKHQSILVVNWV
jgi:hypothetical protein